MSEEVVLSDEVVLVDEVVLIDCGTCKVAGLACNECVVSVLLGAPDDGHLGLEEERAIGVLADSGLIPPLRLVKPESDKIAG